jgi:hypothetical protein
MSSTSTPIMPHRFAEAIKELPLANLHFKAAEIRNSVAHLESSNQQLEPFANDGDKDCVEAIQENVVVIRRMEERIGLLRREVEGRGFKWGEDEQEKEDVDMNGHDDIQDIQEHASRTDQGEPGRRPSGASLGDEELARRLMERIEEGGDEGGDGDGVHL